MDAGPTKAWLVARRNDPQRKTFYDHAFGKRPAEELYDLRKDPAQMNNVAGESSYQDARTEMSSQLMKVLNDTRDPRVTGNGMKFEQSPFTDPAQAAPRQRPAKE